MAGLQALFGRWFGRRRPGRPDASLLTGDALRHQRFPEQRPPEQRIPKRWAAPRQPIGLAPDRFEREPRLVPLGEAFTPTQPKSGRRRLVGRQPELRHILQALLEDRAHVVLYSERGRGKTSLANYVTQNLHAAGVTVARHTCEAGTDFDSLLRGLLRSLPPSLLIARAPEAWRADGGKLGAMPADPEDAEGCEAALPPDPITPRDVMEVPRRLACRDLVCVVDEFDRVLDPGTRTRLADTIKLLSDRTVAVRFLIVGVSENLDEILGQHPSIQRVITGVHLPLFADRDVAQLIVNGGRETGLVFLPEAVARITVMARGMPYMAQLLGLRLAQAATERGDTQVNETDFATAVARLLGDARPGVLAQYAALTDYGREPAMTHALRQLATAPQDEWGRIEVLPPRRGEMLDDAVLAGGRPIAWECWDRLLETGVMRPYPPGSACFVFADRALMHHVLLRAAHEVAPPPPQADLQDIRSGGRR